MRIISFDVGVRNLAICILDKNNTDSKVEIKYWNVINLLEESDSKNSHLCIETNKNGKICNKLATYNDKNNKKFFCKKHKNEESILDNKLNKKILIKSVNTQRMCILLCEKLNYIHNNDFNILDVDEIIIELQPSKNPRMKSLSNMLYSYFILKGFVENSLETKKIKKISYVSAKYKLSFYNGPNIDCKLKGEYAKRKYIAKKQCEYLLENQQNYLEYFNKNNKKDDLADCYLQGMWYLNKKK